MTKKSLVILGSTGSIGKQALEIVSKFPQRFQVLALGAGENLELLKAQVERFAPKIISVKDPEKAEQIKKQIPPQVKVLSGEEGLLELAGLKEADLVLLALVGAVGLKPLLRAIENKKTIALANKEPMVMAGQIIRKRAEENSAKLIPVDSEHCAIFQLLEKRAPKEIRKVIISASGGPFRRRAPGELEEVSPEQALAHPTWKMGKKISIDSATLMNKALELIEARWLFNLNPSQLEVVIHPQSIVHSLVELKDGSVLAHLSLPDMRIPIAYALFYPQREELDFPRLNLAEVGKLEFEPADFEHYPALKLGFYALKTGGTMPAVMNASNEVGVEAFLSGKIRFNRIVELVERVMVEHQAKEAKVLQDIFQADAWARARTKELING